MLLSLTVILLCQLMGEIIAKVGNIPVPGPVIGMVILFCSLVIRRGAHHRLEATGGFLLQNLSLLFVPAGVGIITNLDILLESAVPIAGAIIIGTVVSIVITGVVMQYMLKRAKGKLS